MEGSDLKSRVAQRRAGGGGPPRQAYYALCGRGARALALLAVLAAALSPLAAVAQPTTPKAPAPADAPPPPPPAPSATPPAVEPETGLEPEVTITTRGEVTYEEYRLHGKLYMVKVTPKRGKPYYLIDHEGGGEFRRSDIEPRISVPNWVIKSW
jgi:hypothetical protein